MFIVKTDATPYYHSQTPEPILKDTMIDGIEGCWLIKENQNGYLTINLILSEIGYDMLYAISVLTTHPGLKPDWKMLC